MRDFAIPLQSRALTYLLNMPESEAEVWIGWGTHVFRDASGVSKGAEMEIYSNELFDKAQANPGDDFFSALTRATFEGRPLTREEMQGYANIAFAAGRDTIINTVSTIVAYFAAHPEALDELRGEPKRVIVAGEELIRYTTPITHIGRLCPVDTDVYGVEVKADHLISLCWASANFDENVFDNPTEVKLDRKPNPHVSFGNGIHNCMGAAHARLIVRTLLAKLSELACDVNAPFANAPFGSRSRLHPRQRLRRVDGENHAALTVSVSGGLLRPQVGIRAAGPSVLADTENCASARTLGVAGCPLVGGAILRNAKPAVQMRGGLLFLAFSPSSVIETRRVQFRVLLDERAPIFRAKGSSRPWPTQHIDPVGEGRLLLWLRLHVAF